MGTGWREAAQEDGALRPSHKFAQDLSRCPACLVLFKTPLSLGLWPAQVGGLLDMPTPESAALCATLRRERLSTEAPRPQGHTPGLDT